MKKQYMRQYVICSFCSEHMRPSNYPFCRSIECSMKREEWTQNSLGYKERMRKKAYEERKILIHNSL